MSPSDSGPPRAASPLGSGPSDAGAERQHRLDALRDLAEHSAPAPHSEVPTPTSSRPSLAPPSRRLKQRTYNRWLVAISGALCVAVLAVLMLSHLASSPSGKKAAKPTTPHTGLLTIQVANDGFSCVKDAAWSHNGDQIAVLGYSVCGNDTHGLLAVYAAATGAVGEKVDLDALVTPQIPPVAGTAPADLSIVYDHVLWTSHDQELDVTFGVTDDRQPNRPAVAFGLLRYRGQGIPSGPQISMHVTPIPAPDFTTLSYATWDPTGSLTVEPYSQPPLFSLYPAESYTWFPPGTHTPAPGNYSPFEPVGDPTSGGTFTIWQPGTLSLHAPHDTSGNPIPPPVYSYTTSFAVQSQIVILDPVAVTFCLQPTGQPAPPAETLRTFGLDQAPIFPTRDKALDAVLAGFKLTSNASTPPSPMALAWRLDGARLAAQSSAPASGPGGARDTVTIYNSASGAVIARLETNVVGNSSSYSYLATSLLRWSPDGTQLALYDTNLNTISVWSAPLLPA